jgi:hypothetical protein
MGLTVHVPTQVSVAREGLPVYLSTNPDTPVVLVVRVVRVQSEQHGSVYRTVLRGVSDPWGHFVGRLHLAHLPKMPVKAVLRVTAHAGSAFATRTVTIILVR